MTTTLSTHDTPQSRKELIDAVNSIRIAIPKQCIQSGHKWPPPEATADLYNTISHTRCGEVVTEQSFIGNFAVVLIDDVFLNADGGLVVKSGDRHVALAVEGLNETRLRNILKQLQKLQRTI